MQIKQLEALVNVIDFRSFSKAAEATYISQPTISSHIRILEREVGRKLVIRSTKEIFPSHAGKILYSYAKEILKLRDRALLELKQDHSEISGTIQIAISDYPAQFFLPELLKDVSEKYAELSFRIHNFDSGKVAQAVLDDQAEIGITESNIEKRNLVFEPVSKIHYVIVLPNQEAYQKFRNHSFSNKELMKSAPFIICEDSEVINKTTMRYLNDLGLESRDLNVIASMQNPNAIVEAVKKGLGISLLPEAFVKNDADLILLTDTESESLIQDLHLVYHANKPLSPISEMFVQELRKQLSNKDL